jgi:putative ABC transport system permease protein
MQTLWQDLRYGVRTLTRTPGFTLIAVLTLALGIGASTAIYSVVNAVLLRPLPYADAERLAVPLSVNAERGANDSNVTYADYLDWKNEGVFEHVAVIDGTLDHADLSGGDGEPERVRLAVVSEDYFTVLRTRALRGRFFAAEDYAVSGPARGLVISDGLWKRRFGSDSEIVGKSIYLNGRPYPVVGVADGRRTWPEGRDVFVPLAVGTNPGPDLLRRDNMVFLALARLKPGSSFEATDAVLAGMAQRLEKEHPESRAGWTNRAKPLLDHVVGTQLRSSLLMLLAAVGFVLLITCVNVSNLLLTRSAARGHELAIRLALGAGRLRLIRQLLTEGLLLSILGGGAGLLLAIWSVGLLKRIVPPETPRLEEIGVSTGVLLFALSLSLACALLCGLFPAWQAARSEIQLALKESSRSGGSRPQRQRLKNALVVTEVALSLVLLIGAGLTLRSLARVQRIDPGLKVERLVTMELNAPSVRYRNEEATISFYRELVERLAATSGLDAAAISSTLPLGGGGFYLGRSFLGAGWPEPPGGRDIQGEWNAVGPGYFDTVGMRLLRGRDFDARDSAAGEPTIIVNETFARIMFPGQDPLGRRIRSWRDENVLRTIVGVVGDVRYFGRDDAPRGLVYVPHAQNAWRSMILNVRTVGEPTQVIASIRDRIREVDKDLAVANLRTMTSILERSVAPRRASTMLLVLFAIVAAVLAAVGLYGVLSQVVAQRVHEIGIRMALGARAEDVWRMILAHGMRLAALGIAIGLPGALVLTRLMRGLLYEVSAADPVTYAGIALLLFAVALLASFLPALRAARVDPMVTLRQE